MQVKVTKPKKTEAEVTIVGASEELAQIKTNVLKKFQNNTKVPGFRPGKIPEDILEKHADQQLLQSEFLNEAIGQLYYQAVQSQNLRVVDNPEVSVNKFVPFSGLEFSAKVQIAEVHKLPDYKKIKLEKPVVKVTAKDVDDVLKSIQKQVSEKKDVDRPAKDGDTVSVDFKGVDTKGKPINGADGKNYPLSLGSGTFIPGFEKNIIGLKAGDEKEFDVKFPQDYGVKALAGRKAKFTVNVLKVQEVQLDKIDDSLAKKAGPFENLGALKEDIKKQLAHERSHELQRRYESELIGRITEKSEVSLPDTVIDSQVDKLLDELKRNLAYRGQTYQEMLDSEGKTEEEYKKQVLRPQAEARVKASLVLSDISERENIQVTPEEVEIRLQIMKGQYKDQQMQAELDKPEAKRDIASRLVTEKTVAKLVEYASR